MYVYIDLLLIINFFTDLSILLIINKLLKKSKKLIRLIISSIVGELSILIIIFNLSTITSLFYKILLSILIIKVAFNEHNKDELIKELKYFYLISIILGGIIYFILENITKNKSIVIILSIFIIIYLIKTIKKYFIKIKSENIRHNLKIIINNKEYNLESIKDTGNSLKDPYNSKSVIIINKDIIEENKHILVPFKTIEEKGFIKCFKPDKVFIDNEEIKNILIGESNNYIDFALLPNDI